MSESAFPSGKIVKSKPAHDPGGDYKVTSISEPMYEGMTLRDYFAARAMQTLLGSEYTSGNGISEGWMSALAYEAYAIADAMLKTR